VEELYGALVSALAPLGLAYLHIASNDDALLRELRRLWPNTPQSSSRSGAATRRVRSRPCATTSKRSANDRGPTRTCADSHLR
jgi:hypothetical protein